VQDDWQRIWLIPKNLGMVLRRLILCFQPQIGILSHTNLNFQGYPLFEVHNVFKSLVAEARARKKRRKAPPLIAFIGIFCFALSLAFRLWIFALALNNGYSASLPVASGVQLHPDPMVFGAVGSLLNTKKPGLMEKFQLVKCMPFPAPRFYFSSATY